MPSVTAQEATLRPRQLRQAVQRDGEVVALTFHGKPYGYIVPADQYEAMTSSNNDRSNTEQGAA